MSQYNCRELIKLSEYKLSITGVLATKDFKDMYSYLDIVESNDRLTINFDKDSSKNVDIIYRILEEKGFNIISRVGEAEEDIYLTVCNNSAITECNNS
jgi:hypothetical protein